MEWPARLLLFAALLAGLLAGHHLCRLGLARLVLQAGALRAAHAAGSLGSPGVSLEESAAEACGPMGPQLRVRRVEASGEQQSASVLVQAELSLGSDPVARGLACALADCGPVPLLARASAVVR